MRLGRRTMVTPLPAAPECPQVDAVIDAYLDGELGPEDAELVTEHLEHCQRCGIELERVTRVIDAIRRQRPDLEADALARLDRFVHDLAEGR